MDSLLTPVFDIDLSKIKEPVQNPQNGEDYLKNVIFERHYIPTVLTTPVGNLNDKQNVFVPPPAKSTVSESLKPTIEWQAIQEADFSEVRCKISRLYNSKDEWPSVIRIPFEEDSPEVWDSFLENLPHLSLVLTIRQPKLEFLINFLNEYLDCVPDGESLPRKRGLWIYAILASLKLPLTPEMCSSLRDLARKCQIIRSKLDPNDENAEQKVLPLNLFICIVAKYFRQGDFSD